MENNTVLITGANRGLGIELVKIYLAANYTVFAGTRQNSDLLEQLKTKHQEKLTIVPLDVSEDASVETAAKNIHSYQVPLDIIINNAAARFDETMNPLEDIKFDVAMKAFNINALGPLRITKTFLPFLQNGRKKMLVNISSEAGSIGSCWRDREFDYCMSKAALNMESKLLQNYLKPSGIKVLALHPGWMHTDMGGAEAPLNPAVAAKRIHDLIEGNVGNIDGPIYLNEDGLEFPW